MTELTVNSFIQNPVVITIISLAAVGLVVRLIIWYANVNSDRDSFKDFTTEVRADIKKILSIVSTSKVTYEKSPTRLTDLGEKVSETVNAKAIASQIVDMEREKLKGKAPFEIQDFCERYMINDFEPTSEQRLILGQCAFENGIPIESVHRVIAIVMRDILLEISGYTASDLDREKP